MANIKSAKKRVRQDKKRRVKNLARRSALKTASKKVLTAIEAGSDVKELKVLLRDAEAKYSRAKSKKVVHSNTAARKISRLAKKVAAAERTA